jgi:serine protease Do
MSSRKFFFGLLFASIFGGLVALAVARMFEKEPVRYESVQQNNGVHFSSLLADSNFRVPEGLNFVYAAEMVTPCVVHIKSTYAAGSRDYAYRNPFEDMFRDFFGDPRNAPAPQPQQSAGSGVIISNDGYVVTNNHVIDNASEIIVALSDNTELPAKLIGTDPNTDIALLKVEASGLPFVKYGDSDRVRVGEWVLAVGNPFNLTSTVTAGIVSAKGRNIGILRERYGIESFIQTDAAVNPGNSGGALVNLAGELVGINTAIATPTGSYAGYSFAVPVSLVRKVVGDLMEFGMVQRAVLGIEIVNVNDPRLDVKVSERQGVYVNKVNEGSAAQEAGLKEGDVIVKIDDRVVNNVAELQDNVARHRPGEKVRVTFRREGKEKTVTATLKNLDNEVRIVRSGENISIEGASFRNLNEEEMAELKLDGGVKIESLGSGKWRDAGIREGFVITSIDKRPVNNVDELREALRGKQGEGILIAGRYPNGEEAYYGMGW